MISVVCPRCNQVSKISEYELRSQHPGWFNFDGDLKCQIYKRDSHVVVNCARCSNHVIQNHEYYGSIPDCGKCKNRSAK